MLLQHRANEPDTASYGKDLDSILKAIKATLPEAAVYMCTISVDGEEVDAKNHAAITAYVAEMKAAGVRNGGIPVIDLLAEDLTYLAANNCLNKHGGVLTGAGIHPYTKQGAMLLANAHADGLTQALAKAGGTMDVAALKGDDDERHFRRAHPAVQQFDITKYGCKDGGAAVCTTAIKQAVAAAAAAPPAEVLVPAGRFLTGAFGLATGAKLRLAKGAVLLASTKQKDYPAANWPSPLQGWDWDPALLDTANATDTGIVGEGAIDEQQEKWVAGYDPKNNFLQPITWSGVNGCQGECRPKLVRFTDCSRVTITGVTLRNSPDWTELYRRCSHVLLQGLTVTGSQQWGNNDGVCPTLTPPLHPLPCILP